MNMQCRTKSCMSNEQQSRTKRCMSNEQQSRTNTSLDPSAAQVKISPHLRQAPVDEILQKNEALQDKILPKERQPDFQTTHSHYTFYFLCTVSFGETDIWISPSKKRGCPQKRPPDMWQPQQQGVGKAYFQS